MHLFDFRIPNPVDRQETRRHRRIAAVKPRVIRGCIRFFWLRLLPARVRCRVFALKNFRFPFPPRDATLRLKLQRRAVSGGRRWKDSALFSNGLTPPPPRKSNAKKHDLNDMLVIALLATLSGKSSCSSFARYARVNCEFLSEFLELKGGPPSHDSFSDVSDALNPEQMAAALTEFAKMLLAALPSDPADQVAINGKVLKGATLDASSKSALHPVQAFEPGAGLVLG